jgi:hypothetical protein
MGKLNLFPMRDFHGFSITKFDYQRLRLTFKDVHLEGWFNPGCRLVPPGTMDHEPYEWRWFRAKLHHSTGGIHQFGPGQCASRSGEYPTTGGQWAGEAPL